LLIENQVLPMQPLHDFQTILHRRQLLQQASRPLGAAALASLAGALRSTGRS